MKLKITERNLITAAAVLIIALLSTVPAFTEEGRTSYNNSPREVVIRMTTTSGTASPIMKMTAAPDFSLYGDGRVVYSRMDKNQVKQLYESKLTPKQMKFLLHYVENQKFWQFNENYLNLTVKNLDTTTITVRTKDEEKSIRIYGLQLAARQGMLPKGLINLTRRLSEYYREDEKEYVPDRISFIVYEFKGEIPKKAKKVKWKVPKIDLRDFVFKKKALMVRYKETVLEDEMKKNVLSFLKGKTLFGNRAGFFNNFYVNHRKVFKVAYRPHLPYE